MSDGSFTYNLSLPIPEASKGKAVEVKFAEEISDINSAEKVDNSLTKTDTSVSVTGLDHFTTFFVVIAGTITNPGLDTYVGEPFDETSSQVIINEFLFDPSSGNEWVELYNKTAGAIDLTNWSLVDNMNNVKTLSGIIPANGILAFEKSGGDGWLNNTGSESITLKDNYAESQDVVSYKDSSFVNGQNIGNVAEDQSVCRTQDTGDTWQVCSSPTKGWFNDAGETDKAPLLSYIDSTLSSQGDIKSNIGELDNPSATSNTELGGALYFEKTGQGKIVFEKILNLSDQGTVNVLQSLGTAMDMSAGHIEFDSATATAMAITGAKIYMYGLNDFNAIPNLIVKNDADTVIQPGTDDYPTIVKTWDNDTKTLTFTTSHFTQFDIEYPVTNETTFVKYATIQAAINAASSSDIINVAAGTYNESQILINKPLTLQGAGYTTTTIDGGATSTGGLVKITASSGTVTLSGFTIQNTNNSDDLGHGINVDNGGVSSVDVKILNNAIKNVGPVGIRVNAAHTVQIEENIVSLLYSSTGVIPNGIQIGWPNGAGITGTIKNNTISDCSWVGYSASLGYEGSTTGAGILIMDATADLEISSNDIYDNNVGIDIEAGSSTTIENNDIYNNAYGVILYNANPSINTNKIVDNSASGVYRTSFGNTSGTVDATNNWWGSSDPTVVQAGTSGSVTFRPYYTDSAKTILSPTAPGIPTTDSTTPTNNGIMDISRW
ncbi:MAG: hypothetical protein UW16_C0026G0001 [Microgenomates group bacterium GW2011_GWC1_44_10]|nr:MAG: hypothetical protein UW16_C0026G0001 [Microgenomates group bacterium GW2011_GWC1_44_10]